MLTLHYQNIGVINAFIRAAETTPASWPNGTIQSLKNLIEAPATGLQAVVDTLSAAMREFHNKASTLGGQIADAIDDLEEGLKNGEDYTVAPHLAGALLNIRDLIRGTPRIDADGNEFGFSTCWPSCSGSSSRYGGLDLPPVNSGGG